MTAELFALASAIFFAMSAVTIRTALNRHASPFGSVIVFSSGLVLIWSIIFIMGYGFPSYSATMLFTVRGFLDPGLASLFIFTAFRKVGVSITVPIIAASPLVSTALSVLLLKEVLTLPIILGTILIIGGVAMLALRHPNSRINKKYIVIAAIGSVFVGLGAVITKFALNISNAPFTGLAISLSSAILLQVLIITLLGKWSDVPRNLEKAKFFLIAGIFSSSGFLFSFLAISKGAVSVVFPIISTQPLFALFLSRILLKKHETITRYVVLGTAMVVSGASLLALV